ncbi:hypothetical protein FOA52_003407 [Chlamydomonas sp. UWO 241]|nr:hypothetical protein FOA52_003407 [Chlamydomonas sp. UWO 241]
MMDVNLDQISARAALLACQDLYTSAYDDIDADVDDLDYHDNTRQPAVAAKRKATKGKGTKLTAAAAAADKEDDGMCRNQTGYIGVRQRKWGMFAAEIRDGDKRRWLGSFPSGREAGMAYDAASISQKGCKAKTNFIYDDYASIPRKEAEAGGAVRWDLLPKDVLERFPKPDPTNAGPLAAHAAGGRGGSGGGGRARPDTAAPHASGRGAPAAAAHDAYEQPPKRSRSSNGAAAQRGASVSGAANCMSDGGFDTAMGGQTGAAMASQFGLDIGAHSMYESADTELAIAAQMALGTPFGMTAMLHGVGMYAPPHYDDSAMYGMDGGGGGAGGGAKAHGHPHGRPPAHGRPGTHGGRMQPHAAQGAGRAGRSSAHHSPGAGRPRRSDDSMPNGDLHGHESSRGGASPSMKHEHRHEQQHHHGMHAGGYDHGAHYNDHKPVMMGMPGVPTIGMMAQQHHGMAMGMFNSTPGPTTGGAVMQQHQHHMGGHMGDAAAYHHHMASQAYHGHGMHPGGAMHPYEHHHAHAAGGGGGLPYASYPPAEQLYEDEYHGYQDEDDEDEEDFALQGAQQGVDPITMQRWHAVNSRPASLASVLKRASDAGTECEFDAQTGVDVYTVDASLANEGANAIVAAAKVAAKRYSSGGGAPPS